MTTNNKNLTILKTGGAMAKSAILNNNNAFYAFAKSLGAAMEIPLFLARFNDEKLNRAYYGCDMGRQSCSEHTPVIATRIGNDGISREVVIPWDRATNEEKETFEMPVRELFEKVLDIMLRSFIKASVEVKAERDVSLLKVKIPPKEATYEIKLQLAREIEDFRENYLV